MKAEVTIDFHGDAEARDAGLLFRTTGAAIGYDAQRGYFAGLIPRTQLVILGRTDGSKWQELARGESDDRHNASPATFRTDAGGPHYRLDTTASKKSSHTDSTYGHGGIGIRVVNSDAGLF